MVSKFSWLLRYLPEPAVDWLRLVRVVWLPKEYEPELSAMIRHLVRPGWVCVDVGANIGVITRMLAQLVGPAGRVVSFEAFPKNAEMLAKVARLSGLAKQITVENRAVSDGSEPEVTLFPGRGAASEEWNIVGHDVNGGVCTGALHIPAISLDEYFPPGSEVHFVKIDIEGAGAFALKGMRRILQESRPVVFVEFHDEEEWKGRKELLDARYDLYDMKGRKLDPEIDIMRVYHCLACPSEVEFHLFHEHN